ncbi:BnaUnng01200D [Brassica napus]|uniref:BnaUnng01200D protein n=1 Tax=Brassica napus TaxID=3708 RepID=A0A078JH73_BRANA|nr:BnaUnng01200D [Brassica napus]
MNLVSILLGGSSFPEARLCYRTVLIVQISASCQSHGFYSSERTNCVSSFQGTNDFSCRLHFELFQNG